MEEIIAIALKAADRGLKMRKGGITIGDLPELRKRLNEALKEREPEGIDLGSAEVDIEPRPEPVPKPKPKPVPKPVPKPKPKSAPYVPNAGIVPQPLAELLNAAAPVS